MQTIIAAFDDSQAAQRAVARLVEQGFSRDSVHLQSGYDDDTTTPTSSRTADTDHHGFFSSVGDFFGSLFGDEPHKADAGNYAEAVRRGSTVVVVDAQTDIEVDKARALMAEAGSVDVDQRASQWKSQGWTGFDATAKPLSRDELTAERQTVMPVVQEELQVGKRTVEQGGVRVVKRVTETPVSELVKLRQERATIERRPVDRAATEADFANFKEGTIEVRETSEEAVVSKSARVVEEVVVGKEVSERSETVSDTVRRTDVDVERMDAKNAGVGNGSTARTGAGGFGANESQVRGNAKQAEGAAKDAAGSASGNLGQKLEGKIEKMAGNVQEGYGNLKDDLTGRKP